MSERLDVEAIRALLPHRYPMLMVDRVLELTPGVRVVGLKNVSINEPFFDGHFPGKAIMPGVMILESMAQVAGLILLSVPEHRGRLAYLGGIDKFRLLKPVVPGDTLVTEASVVAMRGPIGKARMVATVDGQVVAKGEMMFKMVDRVGPAMEAAERGEDDRG
jgi:3-hydroxyacyl-[acyl-carrier-protein] dehydratase